MEEELIIACPISIHGAGQDKTILQRHGIKIQGTKEEKKRVNMQGMNIKRSSQSGFFASNGLSFLCKDMTFTQCAGGVLAVNTKGRLINCVITQCRYSGIYCGSNALIEVEGDQTKVDGNVTSGVRVSRVVRGDLRQAPFTKRSVNNFIEIQNVTFAKKHGSLGNTGFREISSRENQ